MKYLLIASCSLLFFGCSRPQILVPTSHGAPVATAEIEAKSRAPFFRSAPDSFKALISAEIATGDQRQALRYAVTKQDNSIQIEVFPTTSFYTLMLFKSDGATYSLQNISDGTHDEGSVTNHTLQDIFGIALTVDELSATLFGAYGKLDDNWEISTDGSVDDAVQVKTLSGSRKRHNNSVYAELSKDLQTVHRVLFFNETGDSAGNTAEVSVVYETPLAMVLTIPEFKTTIRLTIKKISPQA